MWHTRIYDSDGEGVNTLVMGPRTGGKRPKRVRGEEWSGNIKEANGPVNQPSVAPCVITRETILKDMKRGVGAAHFNIPTIKAKAVSTPVQAVPEEICEHMMVTWNMQGCSLAINDIWDVVVQEKPSVVTLTEVNRAYTSVKRLGACCGMSPLATNVPDLSKRWRNSVTGEVDESTKGGVIILVSPRLEKSKYVHTPSRLKRYIQEVSFPMAHGSGFRVFWVYIPTGSEDIGVRKRVMSYLDRRVKLADEAGELVAVGGGGGL
jgi:hypothetical protein